MPGGVVIISGKQPAEKNFNTKTTYGIYTNITPALAPAPAITVAGHGCGSGLAAGRDTARS
jgi:hypothetical protein